MQPALFFLCLVIGGSIGAQSYSEDAAFLQWSAQYFHGSSEDLARVYPTWKKNAEFVERQNSLGLSYRVSLNKFAHLDQSERKRLRISVPELPPNSNSYTPGSHSVPSSIDWRTKGVVTPVHNQGQLGLVVPFITVDSVAALHAISTGVLYNLNVSEVVVCCCDNPEMGCHTYVWQCVIDIGGLCAANSTKSDAKVLPTAWREKCPNDTCKAVAKIHGAKFVTPAGSEASLQDAVAMEPVPAAINAGLQSFQLYASGIYDDPTCSPKDLDHMVLVVGYGTMDGKDYWIAKNSWGSSWGMNGYILMSRNKNNQCGIASYASFPCDDKAVMC